MRLTIPEHYKPALSGLIQMPRDDRRRLVEAVRTVQASLDPDSLAKRVARAADLDEGLVSGIVRMLVSLYVFKEETPLEEIASEVCEAADSFGDEDLKPKDGNWGPFKEDLACLLTSDHSLGISAKALNVKQQHAHVYCSARLLTDIRPVFKPSLDETPATVLVHTLKVTYHEGDRSPHRDFFVALDARDLRELRAVIDRAIRKEAALKSWITSTDVEHLELEGE